MPERPSAEVFAAVAIAIILYWAAVVNMIAVSKPYWLIFRKSERISPVSGRQYAVKHVDSGVYRRDNVGRSPDAHQVAGFVVRQHFSGVPGGFYHFFMAFAYA